MPLEKIYPLTSTDIRLKRDLGTDDKPSGSKKSLHDKVSLLGTSVSDILIDTAAMQPAIDSIQNDIDSLGSDIGTIKSTVEGNSDMLENGTYGLSAIETKISNLANDVSDLSEVLGGDGEGGSGSLADEISTIKTNLGTPVSASVSENIESVLDLLGTPTNNSISNDILDLDSKIGQIQNNTRTTIALNTHFELPVTGEVRYFKIVLNNYDTAGNMMEPDSAPIVSVETSEGEGRNANLGDWDGQAFTTSTSMVKVSDGVYYLYYKLAHTETPNEQLVFDFTISESNKIRHIVRTTVTVEEVSSTFTTSDRAKLNSISSDAATIISVLGDSEVEGDSLWGNIDAVIDTANEINDKADTINGAIEEAVGALAEMASKGIEGEDYDRGTMSLQAISEAISEMPKSISVMLWHATKVTDGIGSENSGSITLGAYDGVYGNMGLLNTVYVRPLAPCDSFTVEVYEDGSFNNLIARVADWEYNEDGALRMVPNVAYVNSGLLPELYVKITNNDEGKDEIVFEVMLRGESRLDAREFTDVGGAGT